MSSPNFTFKFTYGLQSFTDLHWIGPNTIRPSGVNIFCDSRLPNINRNRNIFLSCPQFKTVNKMIIGSAMGAFLSAMLIAVMASLPLSFAQEQVGSSNNNTVITKTSTDSYIIMDDGPDLVGAFDTVYTITGSSNSLNKSKDSILSIIQDDFDNSPTIGYIRANNVTDIFDGLSNQSREEGVGLPNPFVDLQTINSTITRELSDSIDSAFGLNLTTVTIKCNFGMNIRDWQCEDHGIF